MSSSYKSSAFRQPDQPAGEFKYRPQVHQLQEFFPDYSAEGPSPPPRPTIRLTCRTDLQSLLIEVAGDAQLAAQRISEGTLFLNLQDSPLSLCHRSCGTVGLREKQKRQKTAHCPPPRFKGPSHVARSHRLAGCPRWSRWSRCSKGGSWSRLGTRGRSQRTCTPVTSR